LPQTYQKQHPKMKSAQIRYLPVVLIVLITLVFLNLQINKRSSQTDSCFNICGDARGYYAWLPAIFIYHDLSFGFFDTVEMTEANCGAQVGIPIQDYRLTIDGKTINKYYPGVSVMMLPFFASAHFITKHFTSYPANGYSPLYFRVMGMAGVFYYCVGMLFFLALLGLLGLSTAQKTLTVLLVTFGTNLIYYTIDAPVYSHIYSFALVAAFLYYSLRLRDTLSLKYVTIVSLLIGWIFVARPVNVSVMLLLPFLLVGHTTDILSRLLKRPLYIAPLFLFPVFLFVLYKAATGHYFIYSYGREGFDFLHPHTLQFLFSYDNGLFPYMPLLLMPALFLFAWYNEENKRLITGILIALAVTVYIHSSWWAWTYGFSFGARTMLDLVPLFGMLLGLSLKHAKPGRQFYLLPIYALCCILTMVLYHKKSHSGFMNNYPIKDYWEAISSAIKG